MKRVLLGSLVAAIIAFVFQAIAWMGNFYPHYTNYTNNQDSIMQCLSSNLDADGLYYLPNADSQATNEEKEKYMKEQTGKPWAMVFYHNKMDDSMTMSMTMGIVHNFIAAFLISLILFYGTFQTFWKRFFVAFSVLIVTVLIGVMDQVLWWSFPYQFVCPQFTDIFVGWGLASLWLAFFVKKTS